METLASKDCINHRDGRCKGKVEYRMSLTGTGMAIPRCEKHWEDRLKQEEEINERYPDSPFAPAGFDPAYAGERWDDDY